MIEIWKNVVDYEGLYQVSNLGRVKSLPKKMGRYVRGEYITSPMKSRNGYYMQNVRKFNMQKAMLVHRIVAIAFIPNPQNKPCVNHINGIKTDNRLENLEWVTAKENIIHSWSNNLSKSSKKVSDNCRKLGKSNIGSKNAASKKVIDMETNKVFDTITEAAIFNNTYRTRLSRMLLGKQKNKTNLRYF